MRPKIAPGSAGGAAASPVGVVLRNATPWRSQGLKLARLMGMAAAARAAASAAACHRTRARLACQMGRRDAQELRQMRAAARLADGRLLGSNEQFLLFLAVAADEFVEWHVSVWLGFAQKICGRGL